MTKRRNAKETLALVQTLGRVCRLLSLRRLRNHSWAIHSLLQVKLASDLDRQLTELEDTVVRQSSDLAGEGSGRVRESVASAAEALIARAFNAGPRRKHSKRSYTKVLGLRGCVFWPVLRACSVFHRLCNCYVVGACACVRISRRPLVEEREAARVSLCSAGSLLCAHFTKWTTCICACVRISKSSYTKVVRLWRVCFMLCADRAKSQFVQ